MPKTHDYPFASFKSGLEVANAVDDLGGSCSVETCAHKLEKQPTSGGFRMIISSSVKYGLIINNRGTLTVTPDFKLLKHAYDDAEKLEIQRRLFLKPEVFNNLYVRFIGKTLPLSMLDKIMIREMGVEEATANRVSGYFVKGLKEVGLLSDSNIVLQIDSTDKESSKKDTESPSSETKASFDVAPPDPATTNLEIFTVSINGPGVNNTFQILEEEDLEWVEVAIRKIKRALKSKEA